VGLSSRAGSGSRLPLPARRAAADLRARGLPLALAEGGRSLHAIRAIDETPYRYAIAARVRLIVLSWGLYPALDPTLPAGLSPTVIEGELPRRLGFRGITITDSLEAGALRAFGGPAERALFAIRAGEDLILCAAQRPEANTPALGAAALGEIASGIAGREIPRESAASIAATIVSLREHP